MAYVGDDPINATDPLGLCVFQRIWYDVPGGSGAPPPPRPPDATRFVGCTFSPPNLDYGGSGEGGGGRGGPDESEQSEAQCTRYDDFFEDNYIPAFSVAIAYDTNVFNLLGLAAHESGWGTSSMYQSQNNPFGATPGGFSTPGITYNSFNSAWANWGRQWGPRVAGTGNNASLFVSRLAMNNQGTTGRMDTRGAYNTQNRATGGDPNWGQSVQGAIASARRRGAEWDPSCTSNGG